MHKGLSYFHAGDSFPFSCMEWRTYVKRYTLLLFYVDEKQGLNIKGFEGFCGTGF